MSDNLPVLYLPKNNAIRLPDNQQWQKRFEIQSEASDRVYVIA